MRSSSSIASLLLVPRLVLTDEIRPRRLGSSTRYGADDRRELNPIETIGSGTCNEQMGCNNGFIATCVHTGTEYVTSCSSGSSLSVIGEPVGGSVDTTLVACGPCECYADSLSPISDQPGSGAGGAGNLNVTDCPAETSPSCSSCAGEVVFRFSTLEAKWETHDSIAKLMGCELASIHSAEEQALAEAEIARFQGFPYENTGAWENSFVYIGGKVVVSESDPTIGNYTYEWSDGSGKINVVVDSITAGTFSNFKPDDPNANSDGSGGFNEEYLAMSLDENFSSGITFGEWVDFSNMLSPALYKCCAPASPPPPGDDCLVASRIFQPEVLDSLSELYQASNLASSSCLASCPEAAVYYFSAFETQWETHDAIAKSLGCELATIVSADQQTLVEAELALYPSLPYANQGPWENSFAFIGGKQISALSDPQAGSYAFAWSDGSGNITAQRDGTTSNYTNFKGGDPNGDTFFGPEPYLALSLEESFSGDIPLGQWVDFSNMMSPAVYMCCGAKRDYVGCLAGDEAETPTASPAEPTDDPSSLPSALPTAPAIVTPAPSIIAPAVSTDEPTFLPPSSLPTVSPTTTQAPSSESGGCEACDGGTAVFRFSTLEAKWETHNNIAKLMGCELASIKDIEEQNRAEEEIIRFRSFNYQNIGAWENSFVYIGGKVVPEESDPGSGNYTFEWSDGSGKINVLRNGLTPSFSNFKPDDPNGADDGSGVFNEEYLALSLDESFSSGIALGEWVDFSNMLSPALYKCCAPAPPAEPDCSVSSRIFLPDVPDSLADLSQANGIASNLCTGTCPEAPTFYFSSFEGTWEYHDSIAKTLGCELASILDGTEQSLAEAELALYPNLPYNNQGPWETSFVFIGGQVVSASTDPWAGSYAFEWSDGSGTVLAQRDGTTSNYTNFKGGDPNGNTFFGPEPYLALSLEESFSGDIPLGQWVDFSNMMSPALYKCCGVKRDFSLCLVGSAPAANSPRPSSSASSSPSLLPSPVPSKSPSMNPSAAPNDPEEISVPTLGPTLGPSSLGTSPATDPPSSAPAVGTPTPSPIPSAAPTEPDEILVPTSEPTFGSSSLPTLEPSSFSTLAECLGATGISDVVVPTSPEYEDARRCHYWMPDDADAYPIFQTNAVVRPETVDQVAAAVQCAAMFNHRVSARSGSHSYTAESCAGHLIIDMSLHDSLDVDTTTGIITWGAGQLHGHLYSRIDDFDLVLPGGAESMVGTGGLWLGCGRGMYTQVFGLSCDLLRGVEYVDATGSIKVANATQNEDIFWMAKGSGGLFPGIVTKFIAQGSPNPKVVKQDDCYMPNEHARVAMEVYVSDVLDFINDPAKKSYAYVTMHGSETKIGFNCYGCNASELAIYDTQRNNFVSQIPGQINCVSKNFTFKERLLAPEWDHYEEPEDLLQRSKWPIWTVSSLNGGMLVPTDFNITSVVFDEIFNYFENLPGDRFQRSYRDFLTLYPTLGKDEDLVNTTDAAYGGRGTKLSIHYKSDNFADGGGGSPSGFQASVDAFEVALVENAGLPCLGFYNYFDKDIGCATTDDEWLAAFFSDPDRIRQILLQEDPDGVFFRNRL